MACCRVVEWESLDSERRWDGASSQHLRSWANGNGICLEIIDHRLKSEGERYSVRGELSHREGFGVCVIQKPGVRGLPEVLLAAVRFKALRWASRRPSRTLSKTGIFWKVATENDASWGVVLAAYHSNNQLGWVNVTPVHLWKRLTRTPVSEITDNLQGPSSHGHPSLNLAECWMNDSPVLVIPSEFGVVKDMMRAFRGFRRGFRGGTHIMTTTTGARAIFPSVFALEQVESPP
ncbi:hypothetical protein FA13DRAFT_1721749 [Coprinellus micaceus]|uniref:Uncharacterized protein n=1 Tax=Coprinellus micaceus TaxID=71717 RepID=A0A4Y7RXT1_COPMI|nr:hypothetical protein FA13DRAFT_1721749 [Coprinellus micaceus]